MRWSDLHDATLVSLTVDPEHRCIRIELRARTPALIRSSGVRHAECPLHEPWGHSASILEARVRSDASAGAVERLELELQSGDTWRIDAERHCLETREH
jgi:hypothetical protein